MKDEPRWRRYLRLWGSDVEADVDDELRFHLESRIEEYVRAGMTPDAARAEAMRRFGDLGRVAERCRAIDASVERETRRSEWIDALRQDLRYAVRGMRRAPGFTSLVVLTLALGIGASTAIFSIVDGVLLRPLPYPASAKLVRIWSADTQSGERRGAISPVDFMDWHASRRAFAEMAAYRWQSEGSGVDLTGEGEPAHVPAAWVSAGFFGTLGVSPALGRTPRPEEMVAGNDRVAVLSWGAWRRRFGGDPGIVGRAITLEGEPFTIVGVMPRDFAFPAPEVELWLSLSRIGESAAPWKRWNRWVDAVARLAPGATLEQGRAEMNATARRLAAEYPETNAKFGAATVEPLRDAIVGDVRPALLVLMGAVAFLLLITCANVAGLLLARATAREHEFAIRTALGAGRGRVVRQLLTESTVLALAGGALGVVAAGWGARALVVLGARQLPRAAEVRLDWRALAFALVVTLLTAVLFGLAPALRIAAPRLAARLRAGARGAVGGMGQRARATLVVAEVAVAVVLVVGAGLMARSFVRLLEVDPGFRAEQVLATGLTIPPDRHETSERGLVYYRQLLERVARVPGVEAVGGIKHLPFKGTGEKWPVYPAGDSPQRGTAPEVMALHVTAGYFAAMGIPLVAGRLFDDRSPTGGVSEVMINHALARRFFPGRSAVGERIAFDSANSVAVIGVVGDVRQGALDREAEPAIYVNGLQNLRVRVTIVARTKGDAGAMASAIRAAIWDVNPGQTITTVSTLDDVLGETVARPRLLTMLLLMFAGFGLLLGALGLYGVLAFAVAQRRQEIGVRMALGASPGDVVRLVVTQAAGLVALGLLLGLAGAAALTRVMRAVLFEVSTTDPASFAVAVAVLALAALAACVAPAWRALRTDPMAALRQE